MKYGIKMAGVGLSRMKPRINTGIRKGSQIGRPKIRVNKGLGAKYLRIKLG